MKKTDSENFYKKIPALAAYIDRIGAEERNFRRFIVCEYRGHYYAERSLIKLTPEGDIICTNKEYAPTKEEIIAIKAAVVVEKFPKAILARDTDDLKKLIYPGSLLHEFHSRLKPGIIMAQERATFKDGTKAYLPWTYFSDGKWRRMEPDGALPFWKPEVTKKEKRVRIMIHEGAKAAAIVDAIVKNDAISHPWKEELTGFEHWGMIGGALAPHRTDYDEIRREKPVEVIYVCDNDWPGQAALQEVSRWYGGPLKGIMFDKRWPPSWDLADEMPKCLFTDKGRYIGPPLRKMTRPATRATEKKPNPDGRGAPIAEMKRGFKEEWFHCVTPEVFVHRDWPDRILTASEFNNDMSPFSDVDDTARLLKKDAASKTAVLKYSPAAPPGIYGSGEGGRFINTHVPSSIKREKGDPTLWLEFIEHLITDENDRHELLRWIATLIDKPEIKMLYGVLLISETQGVGKGTLGEKILAPILGEPNVSYPSENEIVDSNFNYWLAHKRLAVVHEIYAGHSAKAYNRLKSVITDRYITVSKKYQANYEIENWMHVFACSNSLRAIQLSGDDRRWFVPKVTEEKKEAAWWTKFNAWLEFEGGLGIIMQWAHDFLKKNEPVMRGDAAPWSVLKKEVVEEGYSPGMALVANFLSRVQEESGNPNWLEAHCKPAWANGSWKPDGAVLLDTDLVALIKNHLYDGRQSDRLEKPSTIRKVAKMQGWHVADDKARAKKWGTQLSSCRLICSSNKIAEEKISDLAERFKPLDVQKLAQEWKL